jgi:hypothetical protein
MTQRLVRTVEELAAVDDDALLVTVEVNDLGARQWRRRRIWRKYGRHFVHLDPSDIRDGADGEPAVHLAALLTQYGRQGTTPGYAVVLDEGRPVIEEMLAHLPHGTFVLAGEDDVFAFDGQRWTLMDPGDRDNGEYPVSTDYVRTFASRHRVIYTPGDEDALLAAEGA